MTLRQEDLKRLKENSTILLRIVQKVSYGQSTNVVFARQNMRYLMLCLSICNYTLEANHTDAKFVG